MLLWRALLLHGCREAFPPGPETFSSQLKGQSMETFTLEVLLLQMFSLLNVNYSIRLCYCSHVLPEREFGAVVFWLFEFSHRIDDT